MFNMQRFHTLLFTGLDNQDIRLRPLKALSQTSPRQLNALTSDLGWQFWSTNKKSPHKA